MNDPHSEEWRDERAMRRVAEALARAFVAGDTRAAELRARGSRALGRKWPWLGALARSVSAEFGDALSPRIHGEIVQSILAFPPFRGAFESQGRRPEVKGYFPHHDTMGKPPPPLAAITLPPLDTPGDVARWLGLSPSELDWFADFGGWGGEHPAEAIHHYRYRWVQKTSGGLRLLESPKPRLRAIQRKILREILDPIPVHAAAHGCVARRSAVSNAAAHAGHSMVLRLDLSDFFSGISGARVHALFKTMGYPAPTARYLAGLTTHCTARSLARSVPIDEYASPEGRRQYKQWALRFTARHLPQGAPTSAALANLCAYRLDLRLAGAADASHANYTRYVDDMFISSDVLSAAQIRRFAQMAYGIILEEGFVPNVRKTRIMSRARAQYVTGLVANAHPNVPRHEYDRLKAILTNCTRQGPGSQNHDSHPDFRAHLLGRLSRIRQVHPARGARLQLLFDAIGWD